MLAISALRLVAADGYRFDETASFNAAIIGAFAGGGY